MARVNNTGQNVWLRFAMVMNTVGIPPSFDFLPHVLPQDLFKYCGQPEAFLVAWKKVTLAVRDRCAGLPGKTYMSNFSLSVFEEYSMTERCSVVSC